MMKNVVTAIHPIKKRQYFLLAAFLLLIVLCLGYIQLYSLSTRYSEESYISKFLIESTVPNSEQILEDDLKKYLLHPNPLNNFSKQNVKNILIANISKIKLNEENENIFTVPSKYLRNKAFNRDLFVEMKDINKNTSNVIFLETRCSTEKMAKYFGENLGFVLNARQCCAIESTILSNLDQKVYIFYSCPLSDDFITKSPKFVEKLFSYPNVHVVRMITAEVLLPTPLHKLQSENKLESSLFPVEHSSDLLRLALLWRFGGTYSDLDVVTIRSLTGLGTNWAGMEDPNTIANGVLNFEPAGVGHDILTHALEHINEHYDASSWSTNGPQLITPIILQTCKVPTVTEAVKNCSVNFRVYDKSILYPIHYSAVDDFFSYFKGQQVVEQVKSTAYSVHLWNKMSHAKQGWVDSTQAYALLAAEFCPKVYRNCGSQF